jgi:hypothetical protein
VWCRYTVTRSNASQIHNRVLPGTTIQQPSRLESINEGRVPQWPLNSENIST